MFTEKFFVALTVFALAGCSASTQKAAMVPDSSSEAESVENLLARADAELHADAAQEAERGDEASLVARNNPSAQASGTRFGDLPR